KLDYYFHMPSSTSSRVDSQYGHFSVHKNPKEDFQELCTQDNLTKVIIPYQFKHDLEIVLNQYGVNYLSIYPDLEGLSKHLSWFYQNYSKWGAKPEEFLTT